MNAEVRNHGDPGIGESKAVCGERFGRRHEPVERAELLRQALRVGIRLDRTLRLKTSIAVELASHKVESFGEAEDGLRVEASEDAHERVEILLLAKFDGDREELLDHASARLDAALHEDER